MTAQTREALGNQIRELRKANHLSQQKLALMVGVERSYLAKLERGRRNPSVDCLEKIAGGLGVTLSELFARAEADSCVVSCPPQTDHPTASRQADCVSVAAYASAAPAPSHAARRTYAIVELPSS